MLPTGVHFSTYAQEASVLQTRRSRIWLAILICCLIGYPAVAGPYMLGVCTDMFITLMAVYGLYVTVGMAGQINVAQSAFVGVGAFALSRGTDVGTQPTPKPSQAAGAIERVPAALRGLHAERTFGSHLDIDDALAGLREAITLYMTPRPASRVHAPPRRKS